jgi:hypothetical protein
VEAMAQTMRSSERSVAQTILNSVGYVTAGLVFVLGIVVLTGYLLPPGIPSNYKTILGIVMLIYGTYRIVMIRMKQKNTRRRSLYDE